ncbi:MAG TPA: hypothetical protein DDY14_01845 [Chromatiaceae bacterium]|nr:MAG: glycosyltransferase [Thiohalocapsa sp. PB-PSB1]HBG94074.1 hypothetical protein [Chromatiaceae bacterium]HCS90311.1 hypothetical protein [Chromatiaceae bacterium]
MPAYHHQDYIVSAINSLLAQTLQDWEAIIIDDASPDAALFINSDQVTSGRVVLSRKVLV